MTKEGDYGVVATTRLPIKKLQQMQQEYTQTTNFSYLDPKEFTSN